MPIMYVCETCQEHSPETCGYPDRDEIRVSPDGTWTCEPCWDNGASEDDPHWSSLPKPPEYVPAAE